MPTSVLRNPRGPLDAERSLAHGLMHAHLFGPDGATTANLSGTKRADGTTRTVNGIVARDRPQDRIAQVIGCTAKTLRKHFAPELEVGSAKLEAQLAQNLLRIVSGQDRQALIATILALKSRFGWVETDEEASVLGTEGLTG